MKLHPEEIFHVQRGAEGAAAGGRWDAGRGMKEVRSGLREKISSDQRLRSAGEEG